MKKPTGTRIEHHHILRSYLGREWADRMYPDVRDYYARSFPSVVEQPSFESEDEPAAHKSAQEWLGESMDEWHEADRQA